MKVLFVYPNLYGMNMLPPAIGILNSILLEQGHQTLLFDTTQYAEWDQLDVVSDKLKEEHLNARPYDDAILRSSVRRSSPPEDFRNLIDREAPDLLAISVTEDMYPNAISLLAALSKESRPVTVLGGVFPTFAPRLALERAQGLIDFVLCGEGEASLPQLIQILETGGDIRKVRGLASVIDGEYFRNPLPALTNPDSVPLPNYDFFDESRFYRPMQGKMRRMFPVETIRGCPFTCAYCNSPSQNAVHADEGERFLRKTATEKVREQIEFLVRTYSPDSLYFWADTFLALSENEFMEFCEMYEEYRLPFWIQTRPETVTEERFRRLRDVGLLRVSFGVEHGDPTFREKILMRRIDNGVIIENLNLLQRLDIPFSVNNIVGFPFETRDLAFETIRLNREIKSDGINAYSFTPFHGTPLRTIAESAGFVRPGEIARSIMRPTMLDMPQWGKRQIEGLRRCFVLYTKLPEARWSEVLRAEQLTPEGDRIWAELRQEVLEDFMPWGDHAQDEEAGIIQIDEDSPMESDALADPLIKII